MPDPLVLVAALAVLVVVAGAYMVGFRRGEARILDRWAPRHRDVLDLRDEPREVPMSAGSDRP